ncbi:MAG TPA: hypothetical protein VKU41_02905 [Polyangiaceae bacterium]|nr:hypothetical protein [Polyangiaceae bacterium]
MRLSFSTFRCCRSDFFIGALVCLALGAARDATAQTTRVRVRGTSRIDAHAGRSGGKLVLSGIVSDDVAAPLRGARVAISLSSGATGSRALAQVPLVHAAAEACAEGGPIPVVEGADRLAMPTDDGGAFCIRLSLPSDRYVAHLEAAASPLLDGARADVPIDLALRPLVLRLEGPQAPMLLDEPTAKVRVGANMEDEGAPADVGGLRLTLFTEMGSAVADATTDGAGRAEFVIPTTKLGPPGRGELRASFPGSSLVAPSSGSTPIERVTRVALRAPLAKGGRLPAGSPADGVTIQVDAVLGCASRGCTGWPTGAVEARVGADVVGAAALDRGHAELHVAFDDPLAPEAVLKLAYLPSAPWFRPSGEETLVLPIRAESPWGRAPLVLGGFAALAWLVVTRVPLRRRRAPVPAAEQETGGRVIVDPTQPTRGWNGRVVDAHEDTPIEAARVSVERPGFEVAQVIAHAATDATGAFSIPQVATRPGDELVVLGSLHATLRRPMPPEGRLQIALKSRKRSLLDGLVTWAQRQPRHEAARGTNGEPTPAEVRREARGEEIVAHWAEAVENAAYAGGVVDARAQASVEGLAPVDAPRDPLDKRGEPSGPASGPSRAR